ncbi:hypothetical protein F4780DRAFT_781914 [Xylariomycetidae sp. FL0641]|nr:hypothetical protein F4780DRAFT_781914 [Xylariomycetidae sp. FL0641]
MSATQTQLQTRTPKKPAAEAAPATFGCGCPLTDDLTLPLLVDIFRNRSKFHVPPSSLTLSPTIPCAHCQPRTQAGAEELLAALETGPEHLTGHDTVVRVLLTLVGAHRVAPDPVLQWGYLWAEYAKAFEEKRGALHLPAFAAACGALPEDRRAAPWWAALLRRLAAEAVRRYEGFVLGGVVRTPRQAQVFALQREAREVGCVADLVAFLGDVDRYTNA